MPKRVTNDSSRQGQAAEGSWRYCPCRQFASSRLKTVFLFPEREAFSAFQDATRLPQPLCLRHEFIRRGGVEFEHLVMAWDDQPRTNVLGEVRRFAAVQVAGNPALRGASVDGQKRYVRGPRLQPPGHALVPHRVPAVIDLPRAKLYDV